MMDDGWWKKVQKVQKIYIDRGWMMDDDDDGDILMRHFYDTFQQDIFMRHIDGLWRNLMTFDDLWYGDYGNGMALW